MAASTSVGRGDGRLRVGLTRARVDDVGRPAVDAVDVLPIDEVAYASPGPSGRVTVSSLTNSRDGTLPENVRSTSDSIVLKHPRNGIRDETADSSLRNPQDRRRRRPDSDQLGHFRRIAEWFGHAQQRPRRLRAADGTVGQTPGARNTWRRTRFDRRRSAASRATAASNRLTGTGGVPGPARHAEGRDRGRGATRSTVSSACRPGCRPRRARSRPIDRDRRRDSAAASTSRRTSAGTSRPRPGSSSSTGPSTGRSSPTRHGPRRRDHRRDVDPGVVGRREQQRHHDGRAVATVESGTERGRGEVQVRRPYVPVRTAAPRHDLAVSRRRGSRLPARRIRGCRARRDDRDRAERVQVRPRAVRTRSCRTSASGRPADPRPGDVRRVHGQQPTEP